MGSGRALEILTALEAAIENALDLRGVFLCLAVFRTVQE